MKIKFVQKPKQKQSVKPALKYTAWALGIITVVGVSVFIIINFGRFENVFAGSTFTTTTTGGNWATNATWSAGSAPGNWANNTANINGNVTLTSSTTAINGFTLITLNSGKTFVSGTSSTANDLSFQNVTFNVTSGDIVIYGNLTLSATALTITSGSLTVTGTLTLTGGSSITSNSTGTVSAAYITSNGSGGTLTVNSGALSVTNSLTINAGTTVAIASGVSASAASLTLSNNSDAILNNSGALTINGSVTQGGALNNNSTGTMQVNGSITSSGSGSSVITNYGNLNVTGGITLPNSGKLYDNPGGKIVVNGSVTVNGNLNLVVGTNVAPPAYADLVIKQSLISTGSGDVLFDRNSRVAIYVNATDSGGGGSLFTVNNGGEVYLNGSINYSGGGSSIINNNTVNPYGLYVNGTVTNSGGGSTTSSNVANKATMKSTNPSFYSWVAAQSSSPLPITLMSFKVEEIAQDHIALTWSTASERNFDKFVVERSSNGKTFDIIGEVKGAGNSKTLLNYSYQDQNPVIGTNYYRLKSVDLDATFEYSKNVVTAEFETSKDFSIYPNPSTGELVNFKINFEPEDDDVISVVDFSGTEVMRAQVSTSNNQLVFNEALKPGMYIVKYSSAKFQRKERLQVK